jgi:hypothetical protein
MQSHIAARQQPAMCGLKAKSELRNRTGAHTTTCRRADGRGGSHGGGARRGLPGGVGRRGAAASHQRAGAGRGLSSGRALMQPAAGVQAGVRLCKHILAAVGIRMRTSSEGRRSAGSGVVAQGRPRVTGRSYSSRSSGASRPLSETSPVNACISERGAAGVRVRLPPGWLHQKGRGVLQTPTGQARRVLSTGRCFVLRTLRPRDYLHRIGSCYGVLAYVADEQSAVCTGAHHILASDRPFQPTELDRA